MQLIATVTVNILFLALVCIGAMLERRVSKLEFEREVLRKETEEERAEILERLRTLEKLRETPPDDVPEKDIRAEKRFTQGVENILNYALEMCGNPSGAAQQRGETH